MGSYGCQRDRGQSNRAFFESEGFSGEHGEILADATVGGFAGVWYAAYRRRDSQEVTALVCLFQFHAPDRSGMNFWYKPIDESEGPVQTSCPLRILTLLSDPPPNDWAAEWRRKCREQAAAQSRRVLAGTLVRFQEPWNFKGGRQLQELTYTGKGNIFEYEGGLYRLPADWKLQMAAPPPNPEPESAQLGLPA